MRRLAAAVALLGLLAGPADAAVSKCSCGPRPRVRISAFASRGRVKLRWRVLGARVAYFTLEERSVSGRWLTLMRRTKDHAFVFWALAGHRYRFRVRAIEASGIYSAWASATVVAKKRRRPGVLARA